MRIIRILELALYIRFGVKLAPFKIPLLGSQGSKSRGVQSDPLPSKCALGGGLKLPKD